MRESVVNWFLARCPWAQRRHYHGDPTLFKYDTCGRCGHLILTDHVENRRVSIRAWGATWGDVYGKSCAPVFNHVELAPDRTVHAYTDSEGQGVEVLPGDMQPRDREELERLGATMLDWVAHLKKV